MERQSESGYGVCDTALTDMASLRSCVRLRRRGSLMSAWHLLVKRLHRRMDVSIHLRTPGQKRRGRFGRNGWTDDRSAEAEDLAPINTTSLLQID